MLVYYCKVDKEMYMLKDDFFVCGICHKWRRRKNTSKIALFPYINILCVCNDCKDKVKNSRKSMFYKFLEE